MRVSAAASSESPRKAYARCRCGGQCHCAPAPPILFGPSLTATKAALRVVAKLLTNRLMQCCCRCQVITWSLTAEAASYPLPSRRHTSITANVWALGSGYFLLFWTSKGHTADLQKRLYSLASARDRQNLDHAFSALSNYMDDEVR